MNWRRFFQPTARERRERLAAFQDGLDQRLAARREKRPAREAACKKGQATRIRKAFEGDRLLREEVEF